MDGFIDPSKLNRGQQQAERLIQLCKFAMTRSGMTVFLIALAMQLRQPLDAEIAAEEASSGAKPVSVPTTMK
jgi:hypothetical protein